MIAVIGEALIDLIVGEGGEITARPGGGPCNTARALGRLGAETTFLGRLSGDVFGRLLRGRLAEDGVELGVAVPAEEPSALAVTDFCAGGTAGCDFHVAGTAAVSLEYSMLAAALPDCLTALHVGTLALAMEPIAAAVERLLLTDLPPDAMVMIDPNCRPALIDDRDAYLDRFERVLHRTDVVKVSVEDLGYLCPGVSVEVAATTLLDDKLALVIVTDGPRPARAFLPGGEVKVCVPQVRVVDTTGAGDAFGGAFLAWWSAAGLGRDDLWSADQVARALRAASWVAALTCTRPGAEPPSRAEVVAKYRWPQPRH